MPPGCFGLVVVLRTTLLGLSNLDGGTLDELLNGLTSRSLPQSFANTPLLNK